MAAVLFTAGCTSLQTPRAQTAPTSATFPSAHLVQTVQMRSGFELTSQPFQIESNAQVLEVSLGFTRNDAALPWQKLFCLLQSRKNAQRASPLSTNTCTNDEPGIYAQWSLLRADGSEQPGFSYDALLDNTNSTWGAQVVTIGLGSIAKQPAGMYRVRLRVLRDFAQLDVTAPQLVIGTPFLQ